MDKLLVKFMVSGDIHDANETVRPVASSYAFELCEMTNAVGDLVRGGFVERGKLGCFQKLDHNCYATSCSQICDCFLIFEPIWAKNVTEGSYSLEEEDIKGWDFLWETDLKEEIRSFLRLSEYNKIIRLSSEGRLVRVRYERFFFRTNERRLAKRKIMHILSYVPLQNSDAKTERQWMRKFYQCWEEVAREENISVLVSRELWKTYIAE
jgi:hypothetical protein